MKEKRLKKLRECTGYRELEGELERERGSRGELAIIIGKSISLHLESEEFQKYGLVKGKIAWYHDEISTLRRENDPNTFDRYSILHEDVESQNIYFGKCRFLRSGREILPEEIFKDLAEVWQDIPDAKVYFIKWPRNVLPQNLA